MKITKEKIQYVLHLYPNAYGNNTLFLKAFWETVCRLRGQELTWENICKAMDDYKPESLVRKRREYVDSTKHQREKEYETWKHYAT